MAALNMLAKRDFAEQAWIIIDHKEDDKIKALEADKIALNTRFMPDFGLHHLKIRYGKDDREALESFLGRVFRKRNIGLYIDEGHLVGPSPAIRTILVAGRSKRVPIMWCSQRASWIDSFIWSQAAYYRVFALQTGPDVKKFNENFPIKYEPLPEFHSYYYDVKQGRVFQISPSDGMGETKNLLDKQTKKWYTKI